LRQTLRRLVLPALVLTAAALAGCAGSGQGAAQNQASHSRGNAPDPFDAAQNASPNAQTLFRLARILAGQGRDDECRFVLVELNTKYPEFAPAWCDLAELHMRAGRTEEASEVLERALHALPRDARLRGNLGMCYMVKGDYERALDAFSQAAALGSDDARHRSNMAAALGMMGRYDEALAEYEKVVAPAAAHYNLAVLAKARQDQPRAEQELTLATTIDPEIGQKPEAPATPKTR
jgi:tetratricopeptide (TPR) repeat protein